ncbi:MAG: SWIM zinc finger family protein [Thiobacillus sp.]
MYFEVLGSDGSTVYNVMVGVNGGKVRASCTCKAGELGKLCKHQIGILSGQADLLASPNNEVKGELNNLVTQIADTECANYVAEMLAADAEMNELKRRLGRAKRNLEKTLKQHL